MSSQSLLFEMGRPAGLPPHVKVFASGANEAREIRGFTLAGVSVGVAVSLIRENAIRELLNSEGHVFADSGAFSEIEFGPEGARIVEPISDVEWRRRISIYKRLAKTLGSRLSVVAPDRVADQPVTLARLSCYRTEMAEIAALGAEVLIPVQNGELAPAEFYRKALEVSGLDLVPAMPMKKAASSPADVLAFVRAVQPRRIHLLGMGYERTAARKLVAMLQIIAPHLEISMDSNRLRAVTGKGRSMTEAENRMRAEEPEDVFSEAASEALEGAEVRIDYTDAIAEPSTWVSPLQLEIVADIAGLNMEQRRDFLEDPDGFLQAPAGEDGTPAWYELPHVAHALDSAWRQYIKAEHNRAIRTAAVRKTFTDSRIAADDTRGRCSTCGRRLLFYGHNKSDVYGNLHCARCYRKVVCAA
jgi:hypothetical protein